MCRKYRAKASKVTIVDECLERGGSVRPGAARERKAHCAFTLVCAQSFSFDLVSARAACLCSARDLAIASCRCSCSCFARAPALALALALLLLAFHFMFCQRKVCHKSGIPK